MKSVLSCLRSLRQYLLNEEIIISIQKTFLLLYKREKKNMCTYILYYII